MTDQQLIDNYKRWTGIELTPEDLEEKKQTDIDNLSSKKNYWPLSLGGLSALYGSSLGGFVGAGIQTKRNNQEVVDMLKNMKVPHGI